ncbi:hypothetical protein DSO57_1008352 [Entomophthora muscae]|uniref:Uncharacterized protein n=1 Tax=Entomophthora muscae TaxID=34485 RepID=A0ACC2S958_9FUNG|nr:hypothetical protein DSO57_1008352 [Entomophthora muscae]
MSGGFRKLELAIKATGNKIWDQQAKIFPEVVLLEPGMGLGNTPVSRLLMGLCHDRSHHAGYYPPKQEVSKSQKTFIKIDQVNRFNQTVNQKWEMTAPVCQLKLVPLYKLTLINWRNLRVIQYELVNQHGCQKLVTQGFFATWARYLLDNVE